MKNENNISEVPYRNMIEVFRNSAETYRENEAFSVVNGVSYNYHEIWNLSTHISRILYGAGLQPKERAAIIGDNSPHWVAAYFGILMAGGVVTPLLTDFSSTEMTSILEHAEAEIIFISAGQLHKFEKGLPGKIRYVITLEDMKVFPVKERQLPVNKKDPEITKLYPNTNTADDQVVLADPDPHDTAVIIYTSGTTGRSKGVMLSHDNLVFDAVQSGTIHKVEPRDVFLSILPLAHTLEFTIGMLIPLLNGASVQYTDRPPTPAYLTPVLKKIRPTTMLTVPLIIEKIYRNKIKPGLESKMITRSLLKFTPTRILLHRVAGKKLMDFFGGRIRFFGIGGAPLAPDVEKFLIEARFPYAIGYGLTETAPMLSGFGANDPTYRSVGKAMEGVDLRILDPDPRTGEGEIIAKGRNIMKGYYLNEDLTKEVFTDDGYFRTGDLGIIDSKGIIYIKGRSKNMILGPNGENIYPEEIESVINEQQYVAESLVLEKNGKLVALIHPNFEYIEKAFHDFLHTAADRQMALKAKAEEVIGELKVHVNNQLNKNSRLAMIMLQEMPFEKTATKKIKRFIYSV